MFLQPCYIPFFKLPPMFIMSFFLTLFGLSALLLSCYCGPKAAEPHSPKSPHAPMPPPHEPPPPPMDEPSSPPGVPKGPPTGVMGTSLHLEHASI
jgi:hypothetical protein